MTFELYHNSKTKKAPVHQKAPERGFAWIKKAAQNVWPFIKRIFKWAAIGILTLYFIFFLAIFLFRFVNPPTSSFMLQAKLKGQTISQHWVPIDEMNPIIPATIIMSEDNLYCRHNGVDWGAINLVVNQWWAGKGKVRGASTIPMQTAKNLFLWPLRSYLRKIMEIPLAYMMRIIWGRKRTMEIYLNIAQMGKGIYGISAASALHFNKHPSALNAHQAALIAASLPNPKIRTAGRPGPKTRRLGKIIKKRSKAHKYWTGCVR